MTTKISSVTMNNMWHSLKPRSFVASKKVIMYIFRAVIYGKFKDFLVPSSRCNFCYLKHAASTKVSQCILSSLFVNVNFRAQLESFGYVQDRAPYNNAGI